MSVLRRLYKIIRANVPVSEPKIDSDNSGERFASGSPEDDSFSDTINEDSRDAKLAGYCANLEIPYGSDLQTAKKAWKRLLAKYHPDLHSNDPQKRQVAHELTQALNRAYEEIAKRHENNNAN